MSIPKENQARLLAMLRRQQPEFRTVPDETVLLLLEQVMQPRAAAPEEADMESMSAEECGAMGERLLNKGRSQEGEKWLFAAREKAEQASDLKALCQAANLLGRLHRDRGEFPQAMTLYRQALELAERLGERRLQGAIHEQIGSACRIQGQYPRAIEHYKKSLEVAEEQEDEAGQAVAYAGLGCVYADQSVLDQTIAMHEKALEIMQRIGDEPGAARQYGCLANCYREKGDTARALELYRKSLDSLERVGDPHNATHICFNMGILYRDDIHDPAQARTHFEMAKALYEMVGDAQGVQKTVRALSGA
ncbi:MAG: tetratricopeptide repeat protein [Gammaproteobacteria bacterium]|nr:tetratricopeptide repeat protein [Gammaproteobacteria bacterium]